MQKSRGCGFFAFDPTNGSRNWRLQGMLLVLTLLLPVAGLQAEEDNAEASASASSAGALAQETAADAEGASAEEMAATGGLWQPIWQATGRRAPCLNG